MSMILDGTNGVTYPGGKVQPDASSPYVMKNKIINGNFVIDQRNAGASYSTTPIDGIYTLDRWQAVFSQANKFTVQQNAGSVTPPTGFTNYLGITSSSAYSSASGDYFYIHQKIEGYNAADLDFGKSTAKTITISFWVRSSLTGTFGGALANSDNSRNYAFSYTISSANTWEQKSVTIAGDTSGTWATTNGIGLRVLFNIGSGSSLLTTGGSWGSTWVSGVTGSTAVTGTNGATFYITGVQLEVGSTATAFEWRPYGMELSLCQRYYAKSWDTNYAVGTLAGAEGVVDIYVPNGGTGQFRTTVFWPVEMRTDPTVVAYDNTNPPTAGKVYKGGSGKTATYGTLGTRAGTIGTADATSAFELYFYWTASAEL